MFELANSLAVCDIALSETHSDLFRRSSGSRALPHDCPRREIPKERPAGNQNVRRRGLPAPPLAVLRQGPDFPSTSRRDRNESGGVLWRKPQENLLIRTTSHSLALPDFAKKNLSTAKKNSYTHRKILERPYHFP